MYLSSISLMSALTICLTVAQVTITVDTTTTYQTIDGFGFSEAFGFGEAVQNAPSAQQTQALNYMFSTTQGAVLTRLSYEIGLLLMLPTQLNLRAQVHLLPRRHICGMEMTRARFLFPLPCVNFID